LNLEHFTYMFSILFFGGYNDACVWVVTSAPKMDYQARATTDCNANRGAKRKKYRGKGNVDNVALADDEWG